MSIPGRKPKPTELKKLGGNPGKRPLNAYEPIPPRNKPRMPPGLPGAAKRLWQRLAPKLFDLGILTEVDAPALEAMCWHYHFMKEAAKQLKRDGPVIIDEKGYVRKHPASQVYRENSTLLLRYAAEFGMSPSSRSRIRIDVPEEELPLADQLFRMVNG